MSYLATNPQSPQTLWQHSQLQRGVGAYQNVGDYSWEFFGPNAFAWEAPNDSAPQPAPILPIGGLSGCGCGGKCGGCGDGHKHGVGQATGTGILGTGLFSSTDISSWGWGEWLGVAAAVYLGSSLLGDVGRGAKATKRTYRRITS
jgi:hypothetical protein